jgi:phenylacetate-CoA ligase
MTPAPTTAATDPRTLARELVARTAWPADRLAEHQSERLRELLRYAVDHSPYYRDVLEPEAPLDRQPVLSKAALAEHFDDIVTDRRLRRAVLEAHLAGPDAAQPFHGHLVLSTSGSTGRPAVFVYSRAEMDAAVAGLVRAMILFGMTPDTRVLGIGAPSPVHISRHLVAGLVTGPGPRLAVTTPVAELVAAINEYQPEAFPTNASIAALLAEVQLAGRLHIAPRVVACTSEVLTADMRDRIRAAWGIESRRQD